MKLFFSKCKHYSHRGLLHLWDHFVPHERNYHHPHVLKHRVLAGYSILLVLLKVLAIIAPIALPSSSLYSSAITPENIVNLTNQTRDNLDLPKLAVNDLLTQAAAAKAQDMAANNYFAHISPSGLTPWSWMIQAGYKYKYAGENLAVHFTSAEGVQEGWLASPSHRANIVNQNYTEIGIGVVMGEFEGYPTTFVVQMFGTSSTATQPIAVVTVPPSTSTTTPVITPSAPQQPEVASATEPVVEPEPVQPVVTLEPVKTEPVTAPLPVLIPTLDESSVAIVQQDGYYDVKLSMLNANSVAAYLGSDWSQLTNSADQPNIWSGQIAYNKTTLGQNGEQLSVVAASASGETERYTLAWVAPDIKTQNFYTFNEGSDRYAKLFGFLTIHNLNDSVRQFYFFFMVFLVAALLINILVKVRIQKVSIIGHTVFVLALAVILSII